MTDQEMLLELVTAYEERILDKNCGDLGWNWAPYIHKIFKEDWCPDDVNERWLEAWKEAVRKLRKAGVHVSYRVDEAVPTGEI